MEKGLIMRSLSIRSRLLLLVAIVLIPLIILNVLKIKNEYNDKINSELEYNEELARAITQSFENYLEEIWSEQLVLGLAISNESKLDKNNLSELLRKLELKNETMLEYSWVSPDGVIVASSIEELIGKSVIESEYLKRILNGEEKVISNLELSYITREPILPIARRIENDGEFVGIAVGLVDIKKFDEMLPLDSLMKGSRFGLIDSNGRVIYHSEDTDMLFEKRKIPDDSPAWRALKGEIVRTHKKRSSFDSVSRMGIDYPISSIGWSCFVTTSVDELMKPYNIKYTIDFFILVLVTLISLVSALYLGRWITEPIIVLKNATDKIKNGDFSVRTNIKGYDEIAVTAEAFDKMAQQIEEHDRLKNQFFSNISHEFKTPLNIILGIVQLQNANHKNYVSCMYYDKFINYNSIMKQNCYRLLRLINNLIDITKFDIGYIKLKLGNYNIVSVIEDITLSVVQFAKNKDIEIVFDSEIEEKIIAFDPEQMERVILNLLSNSIKFTKSGGNIYVDIYDDSDKVIITVQDDGIGIPNNKIDKIFDRFDQVDGSLNRRNEGSGIGLSLVKALIEAHNGSIYVESEVGKGTIFRIELPIYTLSDEDSNNYSNVKTHEELVEKINIEFSDIYDINKS